MNFYFGTYDSGHYWQIGEYEKEIDLNRAAIEEVWANMAPGRPSKAGT